MAKKVTTRNSAELSNPKRREMLKPVGAAGVAGAAIASLPTERTLAAQPQAPAVQPLREVLETLTAAEARTAHYVDRALTGPLASSRPAYVSGLAALDAYAKASQGASFAKSSRVGNLLPTRLR